MASYLRCKAHWHKINDALWINRVWDEAHLENETRFILADNIAASQKYLEWRKSLEGIAYLAFQEKLNDASGHTSQTST